MWSLNTLFTNRLASVVPEYLCLQYCNSACDLFSPFKFRVLPTHDASKVRASGPGLTSGVPASFPVEFNIDAKDAGQGQLSVLITVSNTHTLISTYR